MGDIDRVAPCLSAKARRKLSDPEKEPADHRQALFNLRQRPISFVREQIADRGCLDRVNYIHPDRDGSPAGSADPYAKDSAVVAYPGSPCLDFAESVDSFWISPMGRRSTSFAFAAPVQSIGCQINKGAVAFRKKHSVQV